MKEIPRLTEAFAQILQDARGKARLSQAELAKEIGCARSFISFLETRDHLPSLNTFLVISHALGVPSVELLARLEARLAALAAQDETQK
jgi:transcriptional regulator with XRE-family HTH domain